MISTPLYLPSPPTSPTEFFSTQWALITGSLFGFLCVAALEYRRVLKRRSQRIIAAESMDSTPEARPGCIASPSTSSLLRTLMDGSISPVRYSLSTLSPLAWSPAVANSRHSNQAELRIVSDGSAPAGSAPTQSCPTYTATLVSISPLQPTWSTAFTDLDDEVACACRVRLHARCRGIPSLAHQGQTGSRRYCPGFQDRWNRTLR